MSSPRRPRPPILSAAALCAAVLLTSCAAESPAARDDSGALPATSDAATTIDAGAVAHDAAGPDAEDAAELVDAGSAGAPDARAATTSLTVDFDDGTFGPLLRSYGPTDDPARADPAYTVEVRGGRAHYVAPAAAPGPRLTGFLDLPPTMVPIDAPLVVEFTLPVVGELSALGGGNAGATAIAGCYIRGGLEQWVGGTFGDYWFGFVWSGGARISALRQGPSNLVSEPFTAVTSVSYRLEKRGLELRLFASYDGAPFHAIGAPVTIALRAGGSAAVAVTHVRVLDTSGAAIDVTVDDLKWSF